MAASNSSIPLSNIQFHTRSNFLGFTITPSSPPLSARPRSLTAKCSKPIKINGSSDDKSSEQTENGGGLKKALSGIVDERVTELLNREENRVLLDGLDKAAQRVELAKRELAQIEQQEIEARKMKEYINQLETRASEIAEVQKELSEAREMVEKAELSLQVDGDDSMMMTDAERKAKNKNKERLESIKAAAIAAIVGTLASLPISLSRGTTYSELLLPSAITIISCALYGVTFRYAVRRDLDDIQLKTGTSAAFGVVKGLATLGGGPPLELKADSLLSHAYNGGVHVSENLLIFLFAAVGLDFCLKLGILSPFPIENSGSRTKM